MAVSIKRITFVIQKQTNMKTTLPTEITSVDAAKSLLTDLYNNGEAFHCEDDANDCLAGIATKDEGDLLNKLMNDIYSLSGNEDASNMAFDPCGFLLSLDPEYTME